MGKGLWGPGDSRLGPSDVVAAQLVYLDLADKMPLALHSKGHNACHPLGWESQVNRSLWDQRREGA